jgi:1,4-dihydroxy-2-naphthoyl-CoA synthase
MPYVLVEKPCPHVSVVTLNRPERMNAMSFDTVGPLYEALERVGADNDTWTVVLTGECERHDEWLQGCSFCRLDRPCDDVLLMGHMAGGVALVAEGGSIA